MTQTLRAYLVGVLVAAFGGVSFAQDVHIVLRAKSDQPLFHLGEPITLEVACVNSATGRYLLPCSVVLEAQAASVGNRLSADRINQMTWGDAQSGALPPPPRGVCGTISNQLPSQESNEPTWQEVTLGEPFPVYVGQYRIKASLAVDQEVAERFGEAPKHSSSDEIDVHLDDNLGWKDRLIHFDKCEYEAALTLLPDEDAVAALRRHLGDCAAADWPSSIDQLLHRIVWLKMQVEQPDLFSRMLDLERGRPALRGEEEADLQKVELEQAQLSASGDAKSIRQWFRDQYRDLLLQTAEQLVAKSRAHPELRDDQDFQEDLANSFENWLEATASLPGGADRYVTRQEAINFLKRAGFSQKYVTELLKHRQPDPELGLPEYQR
ncbi:MAG TPA: hypothetical protein VGM18_03600 [Candidatus Sulfotelmatobacter sp.]